MAYPENGERRKIGQGRKVDQGLELKVRPKLGIEKGMELVNRKILADEEESVDDVDAGNADSFE